MVMMVASRRFYDKETRREYKTGDSFHVADDTEAVRLERRKKAERAKVTERPKHVDLPKAVVAPTQETAPVPNPETGLYQRRDMRAEDGRIGETMSPQSLRRGRPPKDPT